MESVCRTSALEDKAESAGNLVILIQAIGEALPLDALQKLLEVAVPLLKFYFHMGVRQSGAALIGITIKREWTAHDCCFVEERN